MSQWFDLQSHQARRRQWLYMQQITQEQELMESGLTPLREGMRPLRNTSRTYAGNRC